MPQLYGLFLLCFTLNLAVTCAFAQGTEIPSAFKDYNKIKLNGYPLNLAPQLKYSMIKNDEKLQEDFGYAYGDEVVRIECENYVVDIGFTSAPSDDPSYLIFVRKSKSAFWKNINATNLAVSSACQFYPSGHTNNSFDMRRKFTIKNNNTIQEVSQPFYLVDKTCEVNQEVALTTQPCGKGSIVAKLPKGSNVRILLSEPFKEDENGYLRGKCDRSESYLVNTPFGLVGWVETNVGTILGPGWPLSCIYTNGD